MAEKSIFHMFHFFITHMLKASMKFWVFNFFVKINFHTNFKPILRRSKTTFRSSLCGNGFFVLDLWIFIMKKEISNNRKKLQ